MRDSSRAVVLAAAAAIALASAAPPAVGAVRGTVVNATTGEPASGVILTLSSFRDGMTPVDEAVSGADGRFAFAKDLPSVSDGQPYAGAIRAEQGGVNYTEILARGASLDDIRIAVYSVSETDIPPPDLRVVILEPGGGEMLVHESFRFANDSDPPVTYSSEAGTLRFHLPDAAEGAVEVSARGPAGMPLPSSALPTSDQGVYKVDFPLKPGENSISLSYVVPHEAGSAFTLRGVYGGVDTRVAVPEGVSLSGSNVTPFGEHPSNKASIYTVSGEAAVELQVAGEGRLRSSSPAAAGAPAEISIEPAPVARELPWIAGISILILGLGFFHLLQSRLPGGRGVGQREEG